jgi:hypothetical protein
MFNAFHVTYLRSRPFRLRYTTLKIYCDRTNSNITTQFVTEHLLTHQVLPHFKPSTRGQQYVARCSHPPKWRTLLRWKRRSVCCSSNKTIHRHWFNGGFTRIMVNKHPRENPFTSGTSPLLTQVAFVLRRIIRADDQEAKLWNAFVLRVSIVRRNPQGGQASNCVMCLT